jgi:hypothetical protein
VAGVDAGPEVHHSGVSSRAEGGLGSGLLLDLALRLFDGALNGGEDRGVQAHLHALLGVDEVLRDDGGHQRLLLGFGYGEVDRRLLRGLRGLDDGPIQRPRSRVLRGMQAAQAATSASGTRYDPAPEGARERTRSGSAARAVWAGVGHEGRCGCRRSSHRIQTASTTPAHRPKWNLRLHRAAAYAMDAPPVPARQGGALRSPRPGLSHSMLLAAVDAVGHPPAMELRCYQLIATAPKARRAVAPVCRVRRARDVHQRLLGLRARVVG